jgi:putative transposase
MPRPPRPLVDGGCYHLIARGNNRQFLFTNAEAFTYFLDCVSRAKTRYPAKCYHYCLMSNHIHLLLEIAMGEQLPKFMQFVLQGYGRWYQARQTYVGHVWQGRYKSPLVAQDSYFLEAGRYIERNPLQAKLVTDLKDYPWSSYPFYAYGTPNPLVNEDPYYAQLGANPYRRQETYREFVRRESPYTQVLDAALLESPF